MSYCCGDDSREARLTASPLIYGAALNSSARTQLSRPTLEAVVSKVNTSLFYFVSVAVLEKSIVEALAAADTDFDGDALTNGEMRNLAKLQCSATCGLARISQGDSSQIVDARIS